MLPRPPAMDIVVPMAMDMVPMAMDMDPDTVDTALRSKELLPTTALILLVDFISPLLLYPLSHVLGRSVLMAGGIRISHFDYYVLA